MFVKICGITSVADALMAARAGANAIGLNFYRPSPRFVEIALAREIVQSLPPYVDPVGVFVDSNASEIRRLAQELGLRTLQVHGDITPQLVNELREFSVVPAFALAEDKSVEVVLGFVRTCERLGRTPNAVLADAHRTGMYGGTGQVAPWRVARLLVERCPVPVALAGGLTPKNVTEAVRQVRPWGVDVATGVEVAPGRKEAFKVAKFIEAVRQSSAPAR
jgi:phosphoribosylanthranilate isomerase